MEFLPIYFIAIFAMFAAGTVVGVYVERERWNSLIKAGNLSRPRRG